MSSFPAVTSFMFVFVQVFFYSTKISRKVFHKASVFCRRFDTMANSNLIVEIEQGKLKGVFQKSILTRNEYCSFLGIPFAKPPVDSLRFQAPLPAEKWSDDIFDASKVAQPSVQFEVISRKVVGSEDCLYLNVYTPQPPVSITSPKAVMVFFHGGGFVRGTALPQSYPADYLINYDIILVTVAYRLHALGFLNMGTKNNDGNCGLRDQLLGLQWVQKNIRKFGGDPKNVTIFGESAGASSVHFHMLSPLSKGTFNKAILQSGMASCPWSLTENPQQNGFLLGQKLGFHETNSEKLVEYLKSQSSEDICKAVETIYQELKKKIVGRTDSFKFVPSIEENTQSAFIPDHPSVLMRKASPVPLIVGLNDKEGRLAFFDNPEETLKTIENSIDSIVAREMKQEFVKLPHIFEEVKKFYFGDKPIGHVSKEEIADLYTDFFFKDFYDGFDFVTASTFPVYVYEFSFYGKFNWYTKALLRDSSITCGASHADELAYLFYRERFVEGDLIEPELTVIKNMCTMWSNFAKTNDPTSAGINFEWKPSTSDVPYYLQIDKDLKLRNGKVLSKRMEFWSTLSKQFFSTA